jgi:hypothetical protein
VAVNEEWSAVFVFPVLESVLQLLKICQSCARMNIPVNLQILP